MAATAYRRRTFRTIIGGLDADGMFDWTRHASFEATGPSHPRVATAHSLPGASTATWALRSIVAARLDSTASLKISVNGAVDGVAPANDQGSDGQRPARRLLRGECARRGSWMVARRLRGRVGRRWGGRVWRRPSRGGFLLSQTMSRWLCRRCQRVRVGESIRHPWSRPRVESVSGNRRCRPSMSRCASSRSRRSWDCWRRSWMAPRADVR
jgi:hypothetical protein